MPFNVDFSKLSIGLQDQIKQIMAKGNDVYKIDTKAEYDDLCNLLSGTSKKDLKTAYDEVVKGSNQCKVNPEIKELLKLKFNYEEETDVRDFVKKAVAEKVKLLRETFADQSEIKALKELKKDPQFNQAERDYIQRVIDGEEIRLNNAAWVNGTTKEPTKKSPDITGTNDTKKPKNPAKNDKGNNIDKPKNEVPKPAPDPWMPTRPVQPAPKPEKPDEPTEPAPEHGVAEPTDPVSKEPINKKPTILRKDQIEGTDIGEKMAEELNDKIWTRDVNVINQLGRVNNKNAYDFFKTTQVKTKSHKPFKQILENTDNNGLSNILGPIKCLLEQAKEYDLGTTSAYIELEKVLNDIQGAINMGAADPSKNAKLTIDIKIQNLIKIMDDVVVVE